MFDGNRNNFCGHVFGQHLFLVPLHKTSHKRMCKGWQPGRLKGSYVNGRPDMQQGHGRRRGKDKRKANWYECVWQKFCGQQGQQISSAARRTTKGIILCPETFAVQFEKEIRRRRVRANKILIKLMKMYRPKDMVVRIQPQDMAYFLFRQQEETLKINWRNNRNC